MDWFAGHGHVLNCLDTTGSSSQDLHVSHGWNSQCTHTKPANRKHISFCWGGGRKPIKNNGRWFSDFLILSDSWFLQHILHCARLQLPRGTCQHTATCHVKRAEFAVPEVEFSLSQYFSPALSGSSGTHRRPAGSSVNYHCHPANL